jgi:hypothetical protein
LITAHQSAGLLQEPQTPVVAAAECTETQEQSADQASSLFLIQERKKRSAALLLHLVEERFTV